MVSVPKVGFSFTHVNTLFGDLQKVHRGCQVYQLLKTLVCFLWQILSQVTVCLVGDTDDVVLLKSRNFVEISENEKVTTGVSCMIIEFTTIVGMNLNMITQLATRLHNYLH